jgi:hypothetical protein
LNLFCSFAIACDCDTHTFYSIEEAQHANHDCVDTLMISDITSFPDLCEFHNLKFLQIRNHHIKHINPNQLDCLKSLEVLKINYGELQSFSIDDKCPRLITLSLIQNDLDSIIFPLNELRELQVLKINDNPIKYISIEPILKMNNLRLLSLFGEHGDVSLFSFEQQSQIAKALPNCTIWFEPKHPYIPAPASVPGPNGK